MKAILIFVLCLAIFIGLIWGGLKYFTWLLKIRQKGNKGNKPETKDISKNF